MNSIKINIYLITIFYATMCFSKDRFDNEIETYLGNYLFTPIGHYKFTVNNTQFYTIETVTGGWEDTYMYLWSETDHRQIAKDDDGGFRLASKISMELTPGTYNILIRSYSTASSPYYCYLYINGL